jgi:hypothetical protein
MLASTPRVVLVCPPPASCAAAGPLVKPELVTVYSELRRSGCQVEVRDLDAETAGLSGDEHGFSGGDHGFSRDEHGLSPSRVAEALGAQQADLVAVACLSALEFGGALAVAGAIRAAHPASVIAVFGQHPTVRPDDFSAGAAQGLFDWVIRGEAERSLAEIAADAAASGREGTVCRVGEGQPLALGVATVPDCATYPYMRPGLPALGVYLSRGCRYHSAICYAGPGGGVWRAYPDDVAFDLLAGLDELEPDEIEVLDPAFGQEMGWRERLLARLAAVERRRVPLSLTARPDAFTRGDVDAVYGGRIHLHFNLGTLSPTLLAAIDVPQPGRSLEQTLDLLRYANAKGVPAEIDLVFGQPGETRQTAAETLAALAALIDSFPNTSFRLAATPWAYFPASSPEVDIEAPARRFGARIESPEWWKDPEPSLKRAQAVVPSRDLNDLAPGDDSYWRPGFEQAREEFAAKLTSAARSGLRSHESVGSSAADVPHGFYREPRWH